MQLTTDGKGVKRQPWNSTTRPMSAQALAWIERKVAGLNYGDVTILVRGGVIVQIDRLEKERHNEAGTAR
jgi:hypothetical protein